MFQFIWGTGEWQEVAKALHDIAPSSKEETFNCSCEKT